MKKILCLILCLIFALSCYAATDTLEGEELTDAATIEGVSTTDTVEGQVLKTSDDYSDITFWVNFENCTPACDPYTLHATNEYSAGDTTGDMQSSGVVNTDAKKDGTYGLDVPTEYDGILFVPSAGDFVSAAEGRIGMWIYLNSWTDNTAITYIHYNDADNRMVFFVAGESNSDMEFSFQWEGNTTVATTLESDGFGGAISTWIFVEFAWKQSTPIRKIYINGVERGSSSGAMTAMAAEFNAAYFKEFTDVALDYYIARIIISNDSTRDLYALSAIFNYPG